MHLVRTPLGGVLVVVRSLIRTPLGQRCPGVSEVCLPTPLSPYFLSLPPSLHLPLLFLPISYPSLPLSFPLPPSLLPPSSSPPPSPLSPYFLSLPPSLPPLPTCTYTSSPSPPSSPPPSPLSPYFLSIPLLHPLSSLPLHSSLPPSIFFQRCPGS